MPQLPAGLSPPLHVLEPSGFPYGALLALLALALLWWLLRRRRRPRATATATPRATLAAVPGPRSDLQRAIDALRRRTLRSADYRAGCHHLAELLRRHGEETGRHPLSVLTAGEIATLLGRAPLAAVLELLAELQFRRHEPTRDDFEGACDFAGEVAGAAHNPWGASG